MKYYTESIDINLMSSNQLNARSKVLANTLNALSKEAEPDRWSELNNELIKVRRRMDEVRVGSLGVSDSMDITGMSMQQLDVYSRQLKASCELLSNLVSLTDCKQRSIAYHAFLECCELLSNLVSLTDCKQRLSFLQR